MPIGAAIVPACGTRTGDCVRFEAMGWVVSFALAGALLAPAEALAFGRQPDQEPQEALRERPRSAQTAPEDVGEASQATREHPEPGAPLAEDVPEPVEPAAWAEESEGPAEATPQPAEQAADVAQAGAEPQERTAEGGERWFDFGDYTSQTLTTKAWESLESGDLEAVMAYAGECIELYAEEARAQQASLEAFAPAEQAFDVWALNDVATAHFIRGKALLDAGRGDEALAEFTTVVDEFGFAQCWDPKGWFWRVARAAQDQLDLAGTEYDYGDYTSQTLTTKAWEALEADDHRGVALYTGKCLELYEEEALAQQAALSALPGKDTAAGHWALNDVGTSTFIRAKSLLGQGEIDGAKAAFQTVIERFPYAQCWDPRGWFWQVASAASDHLSTIGTPYDFGDYTSEALTTKAWEALDRKDHKGVEIYTRKCVQLYEEEARNQQTSLAEYASKERAFDYWALNDVATCYFILGESLMAQQRYEEARAAFERVVDDFSFAQCWDPKGWFWKVTIGARGRLNKISALTGA